MKVNTLASGKSTDHANFKSIVKKSTRINTKEKTIRLLPGNFCKPTCFNNKTAGEISYVELLRYTFLAIFLRDPCFAQFSRMSSITIELRRRYTTFNFRTILRDMKN